MSSCSTWLIDSNTITKKNEISDTRGVIGMYHFLLGYSRFVRKPKARLLQTQ
jgi:hypothetical protein